MVLDIKMKYLFLALFLFYIQGCFKIKQPNIIKNCNNTFVLSGYGNQIMLFEHQNSSTDFKLLKSYSPKKYIGYIDAFYDCKRDILVALQTSRRTNKQGLITFDIKNYKRKLYKTDEFFNGIIGLYKNGFIYTTAKIQHGVVDTKRYGAITKSNIVSRDHVFKFDDNSSQRYKDYKKGKLVCS